MKLRAGIKKPKLREKKRTEAKIERQVPLYPIVAIGASAGGLEAMTELLKNLPSDTGMAFIYVQHLDPGHKSMLVNILSKTTKMIVQEIDDMDKIRPNHLFIIPPNKDIVVLDGHLKLISRSKSIGSVTIDILFSSLADVQKERVIGIILSGSASDGTQGMKAIKREGGLTFAQDDSAQFKSMPESAIASGVVDFVLSPKKMALELSRISKHPFVMARGKRIFQEDLLKNDNPDLKNILRLLYTATKVDFSQYKMTTVKRRIIRRMLLHKIKTLKEFARVLSEKNSEIDLLFQDMLIHVTSFFRDPEPYKYLKTTFLPKLLKAKKKGETLRIWVPACASGEEVYSLAMLLVEIQETKGTHIPVQIFGSDLSVQAINKARKGIYTLQELESVSPLRLNRFFIKSNNGYRIINNLRELCVFAPQNILADPPFSRLDFISCRNLFIYFDTAAQKKVIATFHYALNDNGFLMLGKSETIHHSNPLFTEYNKTFKILIRKKNSEFRHLPVQAPQLLYTAHTETDPAGIPKKIGSGARKLDTVIDEVLLSNYMPASVVITPDMEIQQFRGSTSLYLEHPTGVASFNILKMARAGIGLELRNAISDTVKTKKPVRISGIEMKLRDKTRFVTLEVVPLTIPWDEQLLLVLFTEQEQFERFSEPVVSGKKNSATRDRHIKKLEDELAAARAAALTISHDQDALNEELQSANEEAMSSNEELQTTNEELATSKEEIESTNEELTITNQELQANYEQLHESYEFSEAIIATMHDAILVLDKELRIKSANKVFYKNFNFKEDQTEGRLLYEVGNKQLDLPILHQLLESTILKKPFLENIEITLELPGKGEKHLLLNASLINQKKHHPQLILLAIADITQLKSKAIELQIKEKQGMELKSRLEAYKTGNEYIRNVFMQTPAAICILQGPQHTFDLANEKFTRLIGPRNPLGRQFTEVLPELQGQGFIELLDEVFKNGKSIAKSSLPLTLDRGNGNVQEGFFDFVIQPTYDATNTLDGILIHGLEITEQVQARQKMKESETQFSTLADNIQNLAWMADGDGWIFWYNKRWYEYTGTSREEMEGWGWQKVHHPDHVERIVEFSKKAWKKNEPFELTFPLKRYDGEYRWFLTRSFPMADSEGRIVRWLGTNTDITEQKKAEDLFRNIADSSPALIWMSGPDKQGYFFNKSWLNYTGRTMEQETGDGWTEGIHPEDLKGCLDLYTSSFDKREEFYMEFRLKRYDGDFRWIANKGIPHYSAENEFEGYTGACLDIQDQKSFAIELEKQVINRTNELKKSHEAFIKSEELYHRLVEGVEDYAIIYLSPEGVIENWNKGAEKIKGYQAEEIIGKKFNLFYIASDIQNHVPEKLLKKASRTGTARHEGWKVRNDGSEFWGYTVFNALYDEHKNIFGFSLVTRDLTSEKAAEDKINEANILLTNKTNLLIEAQQLAHIGSWEWDVQANKVEWSDEMYRIFGLRPHELEMDYEKYLNLVHPDDRERVNGIIQQSFQDQQPYKMFNKILHPDGNIRILNATGKAFTDAQGNTIRMAGTAQDITEQKKYEAELIESEERFLKIFDKNPVAMSLSEIKTGVIRFTNDQFHLTFGYTKEEVIGHTSEELKLLSQGELDRAIGVITSSLQDSRSVEELRLLSVDETEDLLKKLNQTDAMKNFEIDYTRKNGKTFPALVSYEILGIGNKKYTITSYQDITERKKTEELLKNQNTRLEKMNKELKAFAYVSSHDLQEPLRKIRIFSDRILDNEYERLTDSGKSHFARMQLAAKRMQTLIEDLLAYSRTSNENLKTEITDLNKIVEEVKEELKEELLQKQAIIEADELGHLNIIPFQFRQLLNNLISNSIKFSKPNEPPHITIKSHIAKGKDFKLDELAPLIEYYRLTIKDNGIGFEEQHSEKIFEVFQRLHGKEKFPGTGIGLSIVKKIVENHHGFIKAKGELNKGATFEIFIPVT